MITAPKEIIEANLLVEKHMSVMLEVCREPLITLLGEEKAVRFINRKMLSQCIVIMLGMGCKEEEIVGEIYRVFEMVEEQLNHHKDLLQ